MPVYEYVCDQCEKDFEELVRGSAEPKKCPSCGSPSIRRKLSVPASVHASGPSCAARDAGLCAPETGGGGCCCAGGCCHHH
ncbi:MAG: zinc ribbon domain-containing protein [Planctomycetaceae bacterium]|nr:zinc ribbon domain-containing protein [Planctomycetaceae bacterium]